MKAALSAALSGVLWAGVYLLLSGSLSVSEITTSGAVAMLVAVSTRRFAKDPSRRFAYPSGLLRQLRHAPKLLAAGLYHTLGVALRTAVAGGRPGRALSVRFEPGADDPRDRARRAGAVWLASLAPDTFVVRLDRGRDALLHSLLRPQGQRDPRWLV